MRMFMGSMLTYAMIDGLFRPAGEHRPPGPEKLEQTVDTPALTRDEVGTLWTSFQRMTKSLRETTVSKDYLDNILRSMVDSVLVLDTDGTIKTVNQATLDLLGYE